MSQLTRLSQALIDEPLTPRPSVETLWTRSRRRHQRRRSVTAGMLVLIVLGAFSITKIDDSSPSGNSATTTTANARLASYYLAAGAVPNSTLEAVGLPSTAAVPTKIAPSLSTVATNGAVSYVGAEYCPFCAIQRWALLVALSKFGSFTNLDNRAYSSSTDVYPGLASWSFIGAKYTSAYFTFDPTEQSSSTPSASGGYEPLEKMSVAQHRAFTKYNPEAELPFVDMGNHYMTLGASASPSVLEGLTLGQIGGDLSNPKSTVAQAIDGTANYLIAALCTMVQGTTPPICSTPTTQLASKALGSGVSPTSKTSNASVAPTQPPTNAPKSVWMKWSAAMHTFLLTSAANFRATKSGCTITSVDVTGEKLTKPLSGVPAGVTEWSISIAGNCGHKHGNGSS